MSKPNSNHFANTTGAKNAHNIMMSIRTASDIIAGRTKGLDLNEHPVKRKSKTALKTIRSKIQNRSAAKSEYKHLSQHDRLKKRRKEGVKRFWEAERTRIINHQPTTRRWSKEQIADILANRRPKYMGKVLQGHHAYSVSKYPHLADKGAVIYPATFNEHLYGWHGGNFNNSLPGRPIRNKRDF